MTLLHEYLHLRNQQAFQRLLDGIPDRAQHGGALSSSGGKSWTRPSPLTSGASCDVNARDWWGRTVLHLACASPDTVEYVRLLLRHPGINVNLADSESHWTALHRALYNANLPAALLLLQRLDTDRTLQDFEGYTAFDLYNSTLNGTKPCRDAPYGDLYTWGANRNAALGFADGGDRAHPEQVIIQRKETESDAEKTHILSRFFPLYARQVQMSRLHTAVITSENGGNLRLCGFGGGGRLGAGQHTQYVLKQLPNLPHTIVSVALGQDHTLALTKAGEVLSWGLNRFLQLGYVLEVPGPGESFGRTEEAIQATPRKVLGPLKKEVVKGVAASRSASVCWTDTDVYTWGTNNGQLGYDKAAQAIQVLPRKATKVTEPVISVVINDSAMACLLNTQDVICIWNNRHTKIMFPGHAFPSEMQPYRPPQAIRDAKIAKITCSDDTFAALSFNGELFTFTVSNPSEAGAAPGKDRSGLKPQRVWALRKKFSAVKDVALGSDGSIIVCTESGHVFVRSRNLKSGQTSGSGKAFKFQRLSALQRVTQVCANATGAFGALRVEYQLKPIGVCGNTFSQDLAAIQPYLRMPSLREHKTDEPVLFEAPHDEDSDDLQITNDILKLMDLLNVLLSQQKQRKESGEWPKPEAPLPYGADVTIQMAAGFIFPVHQIILSARSSVLGLVLSGSSLHNRWSSISIQVVSPLHRSHRGHPIHLKLSGCHPLSVLILLAFLYTDEIMAPWDHRVSSSLGQSLKKLKCDPLQVKTDLGALAELLELPTITAALDSPIKSLPSPSLELAMRRLFSSSQAQAASHDSTLAPDVILQLFDRDVYCHSTILRARSEFFANFFDEDEWTRKRWDAQGVIKVDMKHLNWRVMDYVLRFMCFGAEDRMFESLEFVNSVDEALEFIFDVMAAANELLLDRLVLLCSSVILQHANIHNACFILADATYLHAQQLIERMQSFIAVNMELFLETGMLDDIPIALVKQLAQFVRAKQAEKATVSRSNELINNALGKHAEWLAEQDIPAPYSRVNGASISRKTSSAKLKTLGPSMHPHPQRAIRRPPSNDDIFAMDDESNSSPAAKQPRPAAPVWKAPSTPRVDMKAVMAEAARGSPPARDSPRSKTPSTPGVAARPTPTGWRDQSQAQTGARPSPPGTPSGPGSGPAPPGVGSSPRKAVPPTTPRRAQTTSMSTNASPIPGLGPMITPTRKTASFVGAGGKTSSSAGGGSSSGAGGGSVGVGIGAPSSTTTPTMRRVSSGGKAWTQPPASAPTPAGPAGGTRMSFTAIQELERAQEELLGEAGRERRTLREIQEEEQGLRAEAEFLAWWNAEEERVRLEAIVAEAEREKGERKASGRQKRGGGRKADQGPGQARVPAQVGGSSGGQGQASTAPSKRRPSRKQPQKDKGNSAQAAV
ncbi:hypothetical protein H0H81_008175 [Sphagnurus paluster]|uniref:BTB domain-containing protein n=1 Tax=Sphagnurus paluster TaxID=117069 RepID=A0A9P7K368_9AGAR|nr:hypothetical protein H0H81_008175 [Sphagnurus paluster]